MPLPLSIYIHIPFCARKCRYCDFYSLPVSSGNDFSLVNRYIDALGKEFELYCNDGILDKFHINTIYIGGGTPSILDVDTWKRLDDVLFSKIDRTRISEWSVECNPESFTMEKARAYAESGVTRLTFGVQSLDDRELSVCGRAHDSQRALEVLGMAGVLDGGICTRVENIRPLRRRAATRGRPYGGMSIAADVIYGLPGQTVNTLNNTLTSILSIPAVTHLSAYELTVAKNTAFGRHEKILPLPPDDSSTEMYELIGKRCAERGMDQYEISNYALPGFESIHNKAYWTHKPYIGLGASAHSYIHPKRWSNVADVDKYISKLSGMMSINKIIDFEETLTPLELSREIIFLGLRNIDGIDEKDFAAQTGIQLCDGGRRELLQKHADSGFLKKTGQRWAPTSKGMLFADMMARELC